MAYRMIRPIGLPGCGRSWPRSEISKPVLTSWDSKFLIFSPCVLCLNMVVVLIFLVGPELKKPLRKSPIMVDPPYVYAAWRLHTLGHSKYDPNVKGQDIDRVFGNFENLRFDNLDRTLMIHRIESQKTHSTWLFRNWWGGFAFPLTSPSRWFSLHWKTKKNANPLGSRRKSEDSHAFHKLVSVYAGVPHKFTNPQFQKSRNFWFLSPPKYGTTPSAFPPHCAKWGHGAFGSVYEARDVKSLQMVVCKVGKLLCPAIVRGWIYKSGT